MKKFYILIFTFIILCDSVSFGQYAISPRVGVEIDRSEREYFGLFPSIEGFVLAKSSVLSDSLVKFVVTRSLNGVNSDTSFSISPTVVQILAGFIENFESVRRNENVVNWNLFAGLASSGPAIESKLNDVVEITIETFTGDELHGILLFAGDSSVFLWQSKDEYNRHTLQFIGKSVPYSNIKNIQIVREGKFWSGFGQGFLYGGLTGAAIAGVSLAAGAEGYALLVILPLPISLGLLVAFHAGFIAAILSNDIYRELDGSADEYRDILPLLKENTVFPSYPPPELQHFEVMKDNIHSPQLPDSLKSKKIATQNVIYCEYVGIPGNNDCISVNYERSILENLWLRFGIGFGNIDYRNHQGTGEGLMLMAVFMTGGNNKIEFGLGASYFEYKNKYFYGGSNNSNNTDFAPAAVVAYRYQPTKGGLLFRIGWTYDYLRTWPLQLSLGWAF